MDRKIYDATHNDFRRSVRGFFQETLAPNIEEWTKAGCVPREYWLECGQQGLLSPSVPEEYGGVGADFKFNAIIIEELAYLGFTGLGVGVHSDIVTDYIRHHGTEAQKQKWLPKFVEGSVVGAIAMTEPGTGSDLKGVKTQAIDKGDHYSLSGSKTMISNGILAGMVIVVGRLIQDGQDLGMTLFIVEDGMEGFSRGRNLDKIGMKAQDTAELFFDNVEVPKENILGEPGKGMHYLMANLPQERLSIALLAMGASQKAFDITVEYTAGRTAFRQPILDFQNTRFKLAELKTNLAIGWAYLDQCLERHSSRELTAGDAAMLKYWSTDMQCKLIDDCLQLHGGYGFMTEYEIARLYMDARIQRIYGGTNEIMKEIIGRDIASGIQ